MCPVIAQKRLRTFPFGLAPLASTRMHRALQIEEILFNIFHHFVPAVDMVWREKPDPVLAALARTCRAFKEPALDALWMILHDLSPLVGCLRKASSRGRIFNWVR